MTRQEEFCNKKYRFRQYNVDVVDGELLVARRQISIKEPFSVSAAVTMVSNMKPNISLHKRFCSAHNCWTSIVTKATQRQANIVTYLRGYRGYIESASALVKIFSGIAILCSGTVF